MNKIIMITLFGLTTIINVSAQNKSMVSQIDPVESLGSEPIGEIIFPLFFVGFILFMIISLVKYFLDYRLKNKLIERGMGEQLSTYLLDKNDQNNPTDIIKLAILFCGIGLGLLITYFSAPIDIHSLAIMALSVGLSYLVYFFYLRK